MAKCTIIFEDSDDGDGDTKVRIEFDPPIDNPMHGHEPTNAQKLGWEFAQTLISSMGEEAV